MPTLDELKEKYASVLELIQKSNVRLDHLHVQDDKLFMQGAAPNDAIKNKVWDQIKVVDASYSDLTCDLSIDSSLPAPAEETEAPAAAAAQTYTVQPGDSLSKIARHFYGNANAYMRIFEANKDQLDDPNNIQVGMELNIPPAE
jgi:LysM repeat protein